MARKVFNLEGLLRKCEQARQRGQKIVLAYGHFNVIHPGHLRFFDFCRQQADFLVAAVMAPSQLENDSRMHYFSQQERVEGVAALEIVDAVYPVEESIVDLIKNLKPEFYVKGKEFEEAPHRMTEELEAVKAYGGRVVFGSGDVNYATNPLDAINPQSDTNSRFVTFLNTCSKYDVFMSDLLACVDTFRETRMLVIGDTIVDQFIACDVLGVSAEAPVLTIRELESREFIGGAAIVACHASSLGGRSTFVSVTGSDREAIFVKENLKSRNVTPVLFEDESRPTTFKIRYMVDNQKLLRVSRLKQHEVSKELENRIMEKLKELIPEHDGIILSDFVYGVITPTVLRCITQLAKQHGKMIFGDLQCSSQTGNVGKFKEFTLITPTEKEARAALSDQTSGLEILAMNMQMGTGNDNVMITLGAQGLLIYTPHKMVNRTHHTEYFPALNSNPVDVAGAGDALLAATSLAMCSGLNIIQASAIGTCVAAVAVGRVGNTPVGPEELKNSIRCVQKQEAIQVGTFEGATQEYTL